MSGGRERYLLPLLGRQQERSDGDLRRCGQRLQQEFAGPLGGDLYERSQRRGGTSIFLAAPCSLTRLGLALRDDASRHKQGQTQTENKSF